MLRLSANKLQRNKMHSDHINNQDPDYWYDYWYRNSINSISDFISSRIFDKFNYKCLLYIYD